MRGAARLGPPFRGRRRAARRRRQLGDRRLSGIESGTSRVTGQSVMARCSSSDRASAHAARDGATPRSGRRAGRAGRARAVSVTVTGVDTGCDAGGEAKAVDRARLRRAARRALRRGFEPPRRRHAPQAHPASGDDQPSGAEEAHGGGQELVLEREHARSERRLVVVAAHGAAPCAMIGPRSTSGVTKCTVQPCRRTPSASARGACARPG